MGGKDFQWQPRAHANCHKEERSDHQPELQPKSCTANNNAGRCAKSSQKASDSLLKGLESLFGHNRLISHSNV